MLLTIGIPIEKMTPALRKFCRHLNPQAEPCRLKEVLVDHLLTDDDLCFVYQYVYRIARQEGGRIVPGWKLLQIPGILLEAVPWPAWQQQNGEMVHPVSVEGDFDTYWLQDPTVNSLCDRAFELMLDDRNTRNALKDWRSRVKEMQSQALDLEVSEYHKLADKMIVLREMNQAHFARSVTNPTHMKCPCGSKRKFSKCCWEDFDEMMVNPRATEAQVFQEMRERLTKAFYNLREEALAGPQTLEFDPVEQANPPLVNQR